jgi:hypothetical protein
MGVQYSVEGPGDPATTSVALHQFDISKSKEALSELMREKGSSPVHRYALRLVESMESYLATGACRELAQRILLKLLCTEAVAVPFALDICSWKDGASIVADVLKAVSSGKVTELRLPFAAMPPSAVQDIFATASTAACPLRRVDLSSYWRHEACDDAAVALASFVASSATLTHLDLSGATFSDQAWSCLADAFKTCAALTTVLCKRCKLSGSSWERLSDVDRAGLSIELEDVDESVEEASTVVTQGSVSSSLAGCNDANSAAHDLVHVVPALEGADDGCALDPVWVPAGSMVGQTADSYNADADDGALDPVWVAPESPEPRTAIMCRGVSTDEDEGALDPVWVPPSASALGQQAEDGGSSRRSGQLGKSPSAKERLLERMARRRGNKMDV